MAHVGRQPENVDGKTPSVDTRAQSGTEHARTSPSSRKATSPRVALVYPGRRAGLGVTRRVEVWRELLLAADADVIDVDLLRDHRRTVPTPFAALPALGGRVVPETAAWSARAAEQALRAINPDTVIFVTPRAYHPRLAEVADINILDFQDSFSRSYRGRSAVDGRPGARQGWQLLAWVTERFERRDHGVRNVTAGWSEAGDLRATWIPNTVTTMPSSSIDDREHATHDVLFFGKISSLPNLDALRRLSSLWPQLLEKLPTATCLVAGNDIPPEVRQMAACQGWSLQEDFEDVSVLCQQARVAVAPLHYANGIQNKVLEAAAAGLPQVLSSQAVKGMAPGFPAVVADSSSETVEALVELLRQPARRLELGRAAHAHVVEHYSVDRWTTEVAELVTA